MVLYDGVLYYYTRDDLVEKKGEYLIAADTQILMSNTSNFEFQLKTESTRSSLKIWTQTQTKDSNWVSALGKAITSAQVEEGTRLGGRGSDSVSASAGRTKKRNSFLSFY